MVGNCLFHYLIFHDCKEPKKNKEKNMNSVVEEQDSIGMISMKI